LCSGRREYTVAEDTAIIEAVLKESKHYSINGNNLWEILASRQVIEDTQLYTETVQHI